MTAPRHASTASPLQGAGQELEGRLPWWRQPLEQNLAALGAGGAGGIGDKGLSEHEARRRLDHYGRNRFRDAPPERIWLQILRRFRNPLVLLLLFAGAISAATGEAVGAATIGVIVVSSVLLDFLQEYRAGKAAEKLKQTVALRANAMRDGIVRSCLVQELVPGDVVLLKAGQLVPADGRVLSARDFFVKQAALTGESIPVEKSPGAMASDDALSSAGNALFMGSSVVSGEATMLVCATGVHTQIGRVAQSIAKPRGPTAFELGIEHFGMLILRVASVLLVFVVAVNLFAHKPPLESFMFALALAVGLTPELLPMIATVTLTRGALRLAARHVIVKRMSAIQDLGAIDVLCTDKTGTLTEGSIRLERHVDIDGRGSETVLRHAWLNCHFETGMRTVLEDAVLAHQTIDADGWRKIDEVPFDFERRRLSVLLGERRPEGEKRWLILKGAPEDVLRHCSNAMLNPDTAPAETIPVDDAVVATARSHLAELESAGFRTLAVAVRQMPDDRDHARLEDESGLTLVGFLGFLDPPKASAAGAIEKLGKLSIGLKIVTGDSELVTQFICKALRVPVHGVLTGSDIAAMDDDTLHKEAERANLFCRVNPMQKNRVILALKANGHAVGYLGDGINDAPALHNADVGISVDSAVDVAREAADLILLRRDLGVLAGGVREGRRTFANMRKYIMMGTSSNFGNMFSMAGAVLFLPFLPLTPVQILLNNMLYDLSELALPFDSVDKEEIAGPQKWNLGFLRNFMLVLGPVSSLFDFLTFYVLLKVMHADEGMFRTGWFIESLATQVLVIFIIRTAGNPLRSKPHSLLVVAAIAVVAVAAGLTLMPWRGYLGFELLPLHFFGLLAVLVAGYLLIAQIVKAAFFHITGKGTGLAA
ncbi:MAG TPA: magnesium-translocating P-type ATPase [Noviherbaspirillum sp.]